MTSEMQKTDRKLHAWVLALQLLFTQSSNTQIKWVTPWPVTHWEEKLTRVLGGDTTGVGLSMKEGSKQ